MTDEEKAEEIAKGFSVIEINGVTFHSMQEMLVYMNNLRKENAELKTQIEKMKRCSNCSFNFGGCKFVLRIKDDVTPFAKLHKDLFCINYDKWELAE